jgi:hypothetical protein
MGANTWGAKDGTHGLVSPTVAMESKGTLDNSLGVIVRRECSWPPDFLVDGAERMGVYPEKAKSLRYETLSNKLLTEDVEGYKEDTFHYWLYLLPVGTQ